MITFKKHILHSLITNLINIHYSASKSFKANEDIDIISDIIALICDIQNSGSEEVYLED